MRELIAAGADVNICSEKSLSPLVIAIRGENINCVKELLAAGVDVNATDGVDTALMAACEDDNDAIVKILLENGADVNFENSSGRMALYVAVTRGHAAYKRVKSKKKSEDSTNLEHFRNSPHTNMVFLLLKAGAHLNETGSGLNPCTVHLQPPYSDSPNVHILKMLSAAGADIADEDMESEEIINLKSLTRSYLRKHLKQTHSESNLYHIVSKLGLPFIIQSYLVLDTLPKYYQDLNNDESEFLLKVSERDIENALELVKRGVDVNVQNDNGMTALMIASEATNIKLLEELYWMGADVNIQNSVGDTALILATMKREIECMKELLKFTFGADTSIRGKNGLTALMHAAKNGDVNCLQVLLDRGADPNVSNDDDSSNRIFDSGHDFDGNYRGTTAIMYAAHQGKADCVNKLIEAGADVNNTCHTNDEREGYTPLMAAGVSGNVQCVRKLIQAGADLNIPGKDGITALMTASTDRKGEIFPILMKAGAEVNLAILADITRKLLREENVGGAQNLLFHSSFS